MNNPLLLFSLFKANYNYFNSNQRKDLKQV